MDADHDDSQRKITLRSRDVGAVPAPTSLAGAEAEEGGWRPSGAGLAEGAQAVRAELQEAQSSDFMRALAGSSPAGPAQETPRESCG
ncbi:unnamed protein product, partial [Prorocentrum cordatum]